MKCGYLQIFRIVVGLGIASSALAVFLICRNKKKEAKIEDQLHACKELVKKVRRAVESYKQIKQWFTDQLDLLRKMNEGDKHTDERKIKKSRSV